MMKVTTSEDQAPPPSTNRSPDRAENGMLATSILEAAGDGIIVTDCDGRIEFVNTRAERIIGLPKAEAQGKLLPDVLRLRQRHGGAVTGNLIELAIVSDEPVTLGRDLVLDVPDGDQRDIEGEISVRSAAGCPSGTVVTFRDVTSRNLEELQKQEEHKMRAVGQLAGAVAHELNNLLTVVIGHSETLEEMYASEPAVRETTGAIRHAGDNIAAVARRLVTLSGRRVLRPVAADINALAKHTTDQLRALLPRGIELTLQLDPAAGSVVADLDQLNEALLDLIRLSAARMPNGGKLEVATAMIGTDPSVRFRHTRKYARLTVADTGPSLRGVATEELFEPSWVAEEGRPSGLGLFAVRTVVAAAHGHLSVESSSGDGAKFVLLLPQVEEPGVFMAPGASPAVPRPLAAGQGARNIMLVEDDHAIRILLRNSFEQRGYHVIEARDGEEALLQAQLHDEPIDILITDVVMPKMDGPTLVRALSETHPDTRVILTSGCPLEEKNVQQLVQNGADYIQKPFSQKQLLARVESVLSESEQQ